MNRWMDGDRERERDRFVSVQRLCNNSALEMIATKISKKILSPLLLPSFFPSYLPFYLPTFIPILIPFNIHSLFLLTLTFIPTFSLSFPIF